MKTTKSIIHWFASIVEDHKGSTSSKRIGLFILLYYLWMMVDAHVNEGAQIDFKFAGLIAILILVCLGVITSEFFKKDSAGSLTDAIG